MGHEAYALREQYLALHFVTSIIIGVAPWPACSRHRAHQRHLMREIMHLPPKELKSLASPRVWRL